MSKIFKWVVSQSNSQKNPWSSKKKLKIWREKLKKGFLKFLDEEILTLKKKRIASFMSCEWELGPDKW